MKNLLLLFFVFSILFFSQSCQDAIGNNPVEASGNTASSISQTMQPAAQPSERTANPLVGEIKDVNQAAFKKLIDQGYGVVVDIRTEREFQQGHIPNAINIPWGWGGFEDRINQLDKSQPALIYCLSGARSGRAKVAMQDLGFQEVVNLQQGLKSWHGAGYELAR